VLKRLLIETGHRGSIVHAQIFLFVMNKKYYDKKQNLISSDEKYFCIMSFYLNLSNYLEDNTTILNNMSLFAFLQNDIAVGPSKFWEDHSPVGLGWKT